MINIAILVLAAGKSSRMKTPKQLVKVGVYLLLETVLLKAKAIISNHVYCVLGANSVLIRKEISSTNVHFIHNTNFKEGLSSSIACGVSHLETITTSYNAVLVLLGDQPAIEKIYLNEMIALFNEDQSKIIASNYGKKFGVPAIFPESYFNELQKMSGDFGAKEILNNNSNVISLKKQTNFIDIDTEEDLHNFRKSILK